MQKRFAGKPLSRLLRQRTRKAASIAEFILALSVFLFVLFPLLNLVAFTCSAATAYLITWHTASAASVQSNLNSALDSIKNESTRLQTSGLGIAARLRAMRGFNGCGCDCYLLATNIYSGKTMIFAANSPMPAPIDTASNLYQLQICAMHEIQPMLNLSSLPFIGTVPIAGKATSIGFSVVRTLEHPEGFIGSASTIASSSGAGNPGGSGGENMQGTNDGWDFPNMFMAGNISSVADQSIAIGGHGGDGVVAGQGGVAVVDSGLVQAGMAGSSSPATSSDMTSTPMVSSTGSGTTVSPGAITVSPGGIAIGDGASANGGGIAIGNGASANGGIAMGGDGGNATATNGGIAVAGSGGNSSPTASGGSGGDANANGGVAMGGNGGDGGMNGVNGGNGGDATSNGGIATGGNGTSGDQGGTNGANVSQ